MSDSDDSAEKSYEATPEKLKQSRREGQVPRSNDLTTAGSYLGFWIAASTLGAGSLLTIGEQLRSLFESVEQSAGPLTGAQFQRLFAPLASALAPWMIAPAAIALLSLIGQQALVFTPKNLQPKLSRISPLSNAKQKFGRSGLFEFAKSAAKLMLFSTVLAIYLARNTQTILTSIYLSASQGTLAMLLLAKGLLGIVLLVAAALGIFDLAWQRAEHQRQNRMSRKEVMDETKNSEGDPEMKQQRRSKGQEIALSQMIAEVPKANVVVVNPTHYAVALAWDPSSGHAPICVAKGVDHAAAAIRKAAQAHSVPIRSDPPTARALYAAFDVGDEITPEHFAPVAAAIRFADDMRRRSRAR